MSEEYVVTFRGPSARQRAREAISALTDPLSRRPNLNRSTQRFQSNFLQTLIRRTHEVFMQKTTGSADEFGVYWEPLAASTIQAKSRKLRKELGKRQQSEWQKNYDQIRQLLRNEGWTAEEARAKASELAWQHAGLGSILIGIDDGDLERSLRPSSLSSDDSYVPTEDQIAEYRQGQVTIGSKVPHAIHFNRRRSVYPERENLLLILREATEAGLKAVLARIKGGQT